MHKDSAKLDSSRLVDLHTLPSAPIPIAMVPEQCFVPSVDLHRLGWPNFAVNSLADWNSSIKGAACKPPADCCLVLSFTHAIPPIPELEEWTFTRHETGGIWQEAKRLVLKRLPVSEDGADIAHTIARSMAHSNVGAVHALFDQLLAYRRMLNEFGLDCNQHVQSLAEGYYPVDLTEEALTIFGVADVPREMLELMGTEALKLAILAPNSSEW
ncbi:hypothetical protein [Altererythrobacter sp. C41]|uniref:hypothetical protein n=1 Tax=Altererythrobacter sp. C41 TaxID=2806021 RepID=UPI0019327C34|nr:hypothetical protein [Altererythrobacter sp. C41]MBM0169532.1 hypothetical protein [Altererythrobacter sp. C41]